MQQMSLDALESESTLEEYLSHLDVSQGFVQLKVFTKRTREARVKARRCYELLLSGCHVLSKKCADVCAPDPFIVVPRGTSNKPTKHSAPTVTLRVWSLLPASFVLGEPLLVSADGGAPLLSICEACADTCRRRRKAPVDERALLPIGGAVILKEAPKARGMLERLVEHHFQMRCGGGSRGCKNESSKGFRVALPILGPHCRHDREAERLLSPTLLPMKEDAHTRPLYPGTPAGEYYSMNLLGNAARECFRNEIDSAKIRGQLEVFFSLLHTRITRCALGGLLAGPAFKVHARSRPAFTLPELRFAVSRFKWQLPRRTSWTLSEERTWIQERRARIENAWDLWESSAFLINPEEVYASCGNLRCQNCHSKVEILNNSFQELQQGQALVYVSSTTLILGQQPTTGAAADPTIAGAILEKAKGADLACWRSYRCSCFTVNIKENGVKSWALHDLPPEFGTPASELPVHGMPDLGWRCRGHDDHHPPYHGDHELHTADIDRWHRLERLLLSG